MVVGVRFEPHPDRSGLATASARRSGHLRRSHADRPGVVAQFSASYAFLPLRRWRKGGDRMVVGGRFVASEAERASRSAEERPAGLDRSRSKTARQKRVGEGRLPHRLEHANRSARGIAEKRNATTWKE